MGEAQTVPMYDPQGNLGDVPYDQMVAASKAGAKPAVTIKSPDGSLGTVPADRVQDAVKAGGSIVPLKDQETQHPGFWHAVASDLVGMAKSVPQMLSAAAPVTVMPGADLSHPVVHVNPQVQQGAQAAIQGDEASKAAGYSPAYRAAAVPARLVGANVGGMEQSAKEGDVAGVAGHAAAPLIPIAAGEVAGQAVKAAVPRIQEKAADMYQSALKPSTRLPAAKVEQIVKTGLNEQIPVSAAGAEKISAMIEDLNDKIAQQIQSGTKQGVTIDPRAVASRLPPLKAKFATQVNPGSDLAAIDASRQEFLANNQGPIPAAEAQAMKQGTYAQLKGRSYGELKSATIESQKALARGIKEELNNAFPELKTFNAQESKLFDLQPVLEKAVQRIDNHQLFGIGTPIAAGGVKAVTGSSAMAASAGMLKYVLDNPMVKSRLAIALNRRGIPYEGAMARIAGYAASLSQAAGETNNAPPGDQTTQK